jgi:hypothetical protein
MFCDIAQERSGALRDRPEVTRLAERFLDAKEPGREAQQVRRGGVFLRELLGPIGSVQDFPPVTSRYQRGWCVRAQAFVTVPRVIDLKVPGSAAVPR